MVCGAWALVDLVRSSNDDVNKCKVPVHAREDKFTMPNGVSINTDFACHPCI